MANRRGISTDLHITATLYQCECDSLCRQSRFHFAIILHIGTIFLLVDFNENSCHVSTSETVTAWKVGKGQNEIWAERSNQRDMWADCG